MATAKAEKADGTKTADEQYCKALSYLENENDADGVYWLEQAAQQDYPPALHALGALAYNKKDFAGALEYYARAANLGLAESLEPLKEIYKRGNYDNRDKIKKQLKDELYNAIATPLKIGRAERSRGVGRSAAFLRSCPAAILGGGCCGLAGWFIGSRCYPLYIAMPIALGIACAAFVFFIFKGIKPGSGR